MPYSSQTFCRFRAPWAPIPIWPVRISIRPGCRCGARASILPTPSAPCMTGGPIMACLPVDNSIAGRVADMHRLLPDSQFAHRGRNNFCQSAIVCWACKGSSTLTDDHPCAQPRARLTAMPRILSRRWAGRPVVASDTAAAAANGGCPLARCNPGGDRLQSLAGVKFTGLDNVLAGHDCRCHAHNTTRFILMCPAGSDGCPPVAGSQRRHRA